MAALNNYLASTVTQRAGVGSALATVQAQQFAVQVRTLQVASRACIQYEYWTLSNCSACPLGPFPTVESIQSFVAAFTGCPDPYVPQTDQWFALQFNASTHPQAFNNSTSGVFSLEVYLPVNATAFNVRTQDYRFYVLPFNALVGQPAMFVEVVVPRCFSPNPVTLVCVYTSRWWTVPIQLSST